ncbi:MAG: TIGR03960 family B12-binding radical SAM protein [Peptococcaceae bacterium]|jgi:radical SAM family uncharacterized protein|nr:TIGR03960 family B12-binding radical SAM protein [Peptococcaceae bacterium]
MIQEKITRFLAQVQKPGRYIGNEWNAVHKDWDAAEVRIALAFPDVYEVGMSHLGMRLLYEVVNRQAEYIAERVFAPWTDMEQRMRAERIPLFSLESGQPLGNFDLIGFSLQYEMSFSNLLNMLDLAGIPLDAAARGPEDPWIIAGGPCAYNPEPLAPFIDFFLLGESEEQLLQVLALVAEHKKKPLLREDFLREAAQLPGVYVPEFYQVTYKTDGRIDKIERKVAGIPAQVQKAIVKDFDAAAFPERPVVPYVEIIHDRMTLEVMRGCLRGCRFCQAGMIYRPVRERSPETLLKQTEALLQATGYQEVSLTSLSSGDYSCIQPLIGEILDHYQAQGVNVSLPSLRLDSFGVRLAEQVQKVRKAGLTFAPEAGSQRLRNVINKGVREDHLMEAAEAAFRAGWSRIKLYFMIGLPTETWEDLDGIVSLAQRVADLGTRCGRRNITVTVSASSFVPKSHTPFQWEPQDRRESLREKQQYLRDKLRDRRIKYSYHDVPTSFLEAVLAKGDRRLAEVLRAAQRHGCRFDGWSEHFDEARWLLSFQEAGVDPEFYAYRRKDYDEVLPWEHISCGIHKDFFVTEHRRALQETLTPDCRGGTCSGCGVCNALAVDIDLKG